MSTKLPFESLKHTATLLIALLTASVGATDLSTTPLSTYTVTSATDVKPNVMFVLDDSGSMDWDFMPDWADVSTEHQFRNSSFNGLAYNPAVTYKPPVAVSSAGVVTNFPNITTWTAVKNDAYGVQSTSTTNLTPSSSFAPYFYTTIPGEYCTSTSLRSCQTSSAASGSYTVPSYLRWCNGSTSCQAAYDSNTFDSARMPAPRTATITVSGSNNTSVSGITVGSLQIMSGSTSASTTNTTVAQRIVDQINLCTFVKPSGSNCTSVGFKASRNSGVVTITAPTAISDTPSVSKTGSMGMAITAFTASSVPGENLRTTITPSVTTYTYPGTNTRAATRTDCAGTSSCTYDEEMTNYANWFTYYRTRMQLMKTAASNAFSTLDTAADVLDGKSKYRLGFMTINNNNGADFVNLDEFKTSQKGAWYDKLVKAKPNNSTPLRDALADAGRIYAGKLNGASFNGVTVTDPLQYSCQRNYTIMSTDGYWNGGAGYKLDGTTSVGNQDGGLAAPYGDGGSSTLQSRSSKLQQATTTAQNQYRDSKLQSRSTTSTPAPSIQKRTSSNRGRDWTAWTDVSSCSEDDRGDDRRECRFPKSESSDRGVTWSAWFYDNSCSTDDSGRDRTKCSGSVVATGSWADASSCTSSDTTDCRYYTPTTSFTNMPGNAACIAVAQSDAPNFTVATARECNTVTGSVGTYSDASSSCTMTATTSCRYTAWTSWSNTTSCNAAPQSSGPNYTQLTAVQCQTVSASGTSDTLADIAAYYYNTDLRTDTPANTEDSTGTCNGPAGENLCTNNLTSTGRDVAQTQHMTTFTLGLGAQGKMIYAPQFDKDYWKDKSGDFFDIASRTTAVPSSGICSWQTSGTCYWPTPASNSNANIDDLWHAAVNGRGTYFSATDAPSLASSLTGALAEIIKVPREGTSAAAASSNPNVTTTDNFVFSSSYVSYKWTGELVRQLITSSGTLTADNWSAARLLDCATTAWAASKSYGVGDAFRNSTTCYRVVTAYTSGATFDPTATGLDFLNTAVVNADETASTRVAAVSKTSRTIYTNSSTARIPFTWTDLTTAGLTNSFTETYLTSRLSQFCATGSTCLTATDKTSASGENLVNFLRGARTHEGTYYRGRFSVLGDIVSSEAKYVKSPLANFTDEGFSDYKSSTATRTGTVYVGANDGMLHAFDGTTGQETWAYIPSQILPNLHQLADKQYDTQHQYFVDSTPEVGDVYGPCRPGKCTGNEWRTILIGGLNRGGTGYYALDITDPADPLYLWQFTDSTMGYTFGNPKITKLKNGSWVVLLSSGYNNADGQGYLYIRNALDGTAVRTIGTGVAGELSHINARALSPDTNNTAIAAYGGDSKGNLWRFDINGDIGVTGYDAHKLISLAGADGKAQPITAKPELSTVDGLTMVYVGTGMYLGVSDISNLDYQSFYGVIDRNDAVTLETPRSANSKFVKQVLSDGTCPADTPANLCTPGQIVRTSTANAVDWATNNGWYIDFLVAGERAVTDPSLALGTLLFTTISPSLTTETVTCGKTSGEVGGGSFLYALDYKTGGTVEGSNEVVGISLGSIIATRPVPIELQDGTIVTITQGTPPVGEEVNATINRPPINASSGSGVRRLSWRELSTQ